MRIQNPFSILGKKVLVTGASSGIGRAIAIHASRNGATIFLTGRNAIRLNETKGMLSRGVHNYYCADLTKEEDVYSLSNQLPGLDGVILNAGMVKILPVMYIKKDILDQMFFVNLCGSILLIQSLLKQKKIKPKCSICFISSVSANYAQLGNSVYSATKGAVNSFTKALALELAYKKVRVNAILPGFVETNILAESPISQEHLVEHLKNFPLGRFGKPEDIALLTVYLLSDASEWMTGSLITIDGGFSIK